MTLIRGVIFDLGMTLIQFIGDWNAVLEKSWRLLAEYLIDEGYGIDEAQFVRSFRELSESRFYERTVEYIEQPTTDLFHEVMTRLGYSTLTAEVVKQSMERFYSVSEAHWYTKDGVNSVLDGLKNDGLRLALISNAGDVPNVHRLLDKGKLWDYFDPVLVSAAEGIRKPHVEIFNRVCNTWKVQPEQIVMVGDSLMEDILGAQRAGIHQIWLKEHVDTPENRKIADDIQPEAIAATFHEIPDIIRKMDEEGQL
jgi:HAD superfamily hydrolase (TIGR01549 family)